MTSLRRRGDPLFSARLLQPSGVRSTRSLIENVRVRRELEAADDVFRRQMPACSCAYCFACLHRSADLADMLGRRCGNRTGDGVRSFKLDAWAVIDNAADDAGVDVGIRAAGTGGDLYVGYCFVYRTGKLV